MRIKIIKLIDRVIGSLLIRFLSVPSCTRPLRLSRFLIIRPGGIGDAVLLIPAIQVIKQNFPQSTITVLAEKRNSAVFLLTPAVDKILHYDNPSELLRAMTINYDVVIDTEQWHRLSAVVARLATAPIKIGFSTNERNKMFSQQVSFTHEDYERDSFLHLLIPLGISTKVPTSQPYLVVPESSWEKVMNILGSFSAKPFVVMFPGASIPERHWGAERFGMVAERLNKMGIPVVVVGGKKDVAEGERIIAGKDGLNLAGKMTLLETAAVIGKSALLLSGDSGVLHIGVGLDKPTVSLFGPGIKKKWAPRGDEHIVINKNFDCSPCTRFGYTPKCLINGKCMIEITVDEVVSAIEKLLAKTRR